MSGSASSGSCSGGTESGASAVAAAAVTTSERDGILTVDTGALRLKLRTNYERWRHRFAPGTTHNTEHVFSVELPGRVPAYLPPRRVPG